jgi:integrase
MFFNGFDRFCLLSTTDSTTLGSIAMIKPSHANPTAVWGPTQDGIRQHLSTKIWHFNKKICRRLISGSSETTSKTLAKTKLAQKIADLMKQPGSLTAPVKNGRQTIADVIEVFKHRLGATSVVAGTQAKKLNNIQSILKTWSQVEEFGPELKDLNKVLVKKLTYDQIISWRKYFLAPEEDDGAGLSNDYFNQCRHIFIELYKVAQEGDPRIQNLGQRLKFAKVYTEELIIPTAEKFAEIVDCISEGQNNGWIDAAEDLIRGLAYTGLRINEARQLRARHVELEKREINLPSSIVKGKRRGRTVPIFDEALALFVRLVKEAGPEGEIFHVSEATETLRKACKLAKWAPALTHHDLRHYFATRCLESTKDVKVVADWLGHSDGGVLVLQTYAHVCHKFANEAAKLVVFEKNAEAASAPEDRDRRIAQLKKELEKLEMA